MQRVIVAACLLGTIAAIAAAVIFWQFLQWADRPLNDSLSDAPDAAVQLLPGEPLRTFAARLQADGLVDSSAKLLWLARLTGMDTQVQAGEYRVDHVTSPRSLLQDMVAGRVIVYQFRIAEGHTVADVLAALRSTDGVRHELEATSAEQLRSELGLSGPFAEGMFFPDTYQFVRGASDRGLLQRAHEAMLAAIDEAWNARRDELAINTPEELVILASIIEKESGVASDRAQISQVFHRRLVLGMRLQTDPTVIYGLGARFDGNLTRQHLRDDTPYNTYRRHGLPPTPIAIPSAAALFAAAQPAQGDYLYFVARGDGSSEFSRTLDEHNRAVRKYQLGVD